MTDSSPEYLSFKCNSIGFIHSPYKEKFAVPRQPGLVDVQMQLQLIAPYNSPEMVRGLEEFSHLWLIFAFHQHIDKGWNPLIRPPRLGGNKKVGVFASRSTFRPNPIGMSVVQLEKIEETKDGPILHLKGGDLVDGTPVLDIKPYLSYADSHPDAQSSYASSASDSPMQVVISEALEQTLQEAKKQYPDLEQLIMQILAQDPRPAYQKSSSHDREYGVKLYEFNICWKVIDNTNIVTKIEKI